MKYYFLIVIVLLWSYSSFAQQDVELMDVKQDNEGAYQISPDFQTCNGKEKLRIGSVDSFQGKEFDIVILSTVRSNRVPRIEKTRRSVFGFLLSENRLNVAFSRAQKLVIVVGDGDMFADDYAKKYVAGLYEFYTGLTLDKKYGKRI